MSAAVHPTLIISHLAHTTLATRAAAIARLLAGTLQLWRSRIRERRAFPVVDDRDLRDLGMSRWELEHELSKPFWRD